MTFRELQDLAIAHVAALGLFSPTPEQVARWLQEIVPSPVAPSRHIPIEGDPGSAVPDETITELVALAKADQRADFDFLAGAAGVPAPRRDALWTGTRARLNKPAEAHEHDSIEPETPRTNLPRRPAGNPLQWAGALWTSDGRQLFWNTTRPMTPAPAALDDDV